MMRSWKKEDILTIPNVLSMVRLGLIPLFLWLYCRKEMYDWAVVVVAVSGVTDVLDGFIARRFNMISDCGKMLDPAADKLTQLALIVSLATRYPMVWGLLALFVVKELTMGVLGLIVVMKTKTVPSAKWFGKTSTAILEVSMAVLVLFPRIPFDIARWFVLVSACVLVFSFVQYMIMDVRLLRAVEQKGDETV